MLSLNTTRRVRRSVLGAGLSAVLLLTGCSGGGDQEPKNSSTPSASQSEQASEPYLDVPEGTELTEAGSSLNLGEKATVAFQPQQDKVGVTDLTVTKLQQATIKDLAAFKLDATTKKSTPYYVRATVKNVGDTNLTGTLPPLYLADDQDRLVTASQFKSAFKPCPSQPLPKKFTPGKTYQGCWLYLLGEGTSPTKVSFYPLEGFDPITWTGDIDKPNEPGQKQGKKKQG